MWPARGPVCGGGDGREGEGVYTPLQGAPGKMAQQLRAHAGQDAVILGWYVVCGQLGVERSCPGDPTDQNPALSEGGCVLNLQNSAHLETCSLCYSVP